MLDADTYHWSTGRRAGGWGRKRVGGYPVMMRIIQGDLSDPRVVDLLRIHLTSASTATAPGSAHALDLSDLQSSDISFWTIWEAGADLALITNGRGAMFVACIRQADRGSQDRRPRA